MTKRQEETKIRSDEPVALQRCSQGTGTQLSAPATSVATPWPPPWSCSPWDWDACGSLCAWLGPGAPHRAQPRWPTSHQAKESQLAGHPRSVAIAWPGPLHAGAITSSSSMTSQGVARPPSHGHQAGRLTAKRPHPAPRTPAGPRWAPGRRRGHSAEPPRACGPQAWGAGGPPHSPVGWGSWRASCGAGCPAGA